MREAAQKRGGRRTLKTGYEVIVIGVSMFVAAVVVIALLKRLVG